MCLRAVASSGRAYFTLSYCFEAFACENRITCTRFAIVLRLALLLPLLLRLAACSSSAQVWISNNQSI